MKDRYEDLNPNWQGGIDREPYAWNWTDRLRESIRKRDNYKCQKCDKAQSKRKIPVHHIDYNKKNCSSNNLITLCHRCNSIVNFDRDYWFAYFTYIMESK